MSVWSHKPQTEEQRARYGPACFENGERCMADCQPWPCDAEQQRLRAEAAQRALDDVRAKVLHDLATIMSKRLAPKPGTVLAEVNDTFMAVLLDELATLPSEPVSAEGEAPDGSGPFGALGEERDGPFAANRPLPDGSPSTEPREQQR